MLSTALPLATSRARPGGRGWGLGSLPELQKTGERRPRVVGTPGSNQYGLTPVSAFSYPSPTPRKAHQPAWQDQLWMETRKKKKYCQGFRLSFRSLCHKRWICQEASEDLKKYRSASRQERYFMKSLHLKSERRQHSPKHQMSWRWVLMCNCLA